MSKKLVTIVIPLSLLLSGCSIFNHPSNPPEGPITGSTSFEGGSIEEIEQPDFTFDIDLPEDRTNTFKIKAKDDSYSYEYDEEKNIYSIKLENTLEQDYEYDCSGNLFEGQLYIDFSGEGTVVINLNGCLLTNSMDSPIYIANAGDKVEISAKKGTDNFVYDLRSYEDFVDEEELTGSAAIYADADLKLKGTGNLTVVSNYNNGVHSKKDLTIQKQSLTVKAIDNAIKGNDSLDITSGTIIAVSSGGDALKTKSTKYKKDGVTQRGCISISEPKASEPTKVYLYAACDGIDASSDVNISGGLVSILTDKYSEYSKDVTTSSSDTLYLRLSNDLNRKNYKYSAYFYNDDGSFEWKDVEFYQKVTSKEQPGGRPGPGGETSYYYFSVPRLTSYSSVKFYAYSSYQTTCQDKEYVAVTNNNTTIPSSSDTLIINSVLTSSKVIDTSGWTSFASSSGNTGLAYSSKGIKADNEIKISGGTIGISSTDDGIHTNYDIVMESTGKTGLGNIEITGGNISITTDDDGIHADQDLSILGGVINVANSYEGLEANRIYISDGNVTIFAQDDGINATSVNDGKGAYQGLISISGGYIDVTVPNGDTDTIDSNGTLVISGGFVFLKNGMTTGTSNMGGTIDTDRGVTVTGGTIISIGCIGDKISNSSYNASTTMGIGSYEIQDPSNNVLISFSLITSYKAYMFWSDLFVKGTTYTVYKDGNKSFSFTK